GESVAERRKKRRVDVSATASRRHGGASSVGASGRRPLCQARRHTLHLSRRARSSGKRVARCSVVFVDKNSATTDVCATTSPVAVFSGSALISPIAVPAPTSTGRTPPTDELPL